MAGCLFVVNLRHLNPGYRRPMPAVTIRQATAEDAPCIGMLGMQVFLDTYATHGIRNAIATEALQAFVPWKLRQLRQEAVGCSVTSCGGNK